ncbi:hypothetical protein [Microbacterium sp. Root180]|uniref:hypothetical protein n=1 Tax=Microbacterium sp. Root180 TaxID=1736483 RepID=UPI0006F38890|nr:hypothetical protein [Microbacterium sp. Root180]KRB36981.1 hypothetical protein ASD93_13285 [Microbacterium sp. Root180]
MVAPSLSFDARPLVEPLEPGAARAFAQELRQRGRLPGLFTGTNVIVAVVVGVVVVAFGSVFLVMFVSIFVAIAGSIAGTGGGIAGTLVAVVPFLIFGIVLAVGVIGFIAAQRSSAERMLRLDRFARANGLSYLPALGTPGLGTPGLPGMIFSVGDSRMATDLVRGESPRFVEFANYRYTTGSGKNKSTHTWGYVAVKLDVPLPHIVLDATGNNALFGSNLPATFDRDQRLSLEGDFDRYFSLYCPAGYERDALYLFTPDIMARFIDNAAALDVEIVDDWLFLYAKRDFSTVDPATWSWLFSVVGALLDKFAQWSRWRDERLAEVAMTDAAGAAASGAASALPAGTAVPFAAPAAMLRPPPGVAPQGRRLTRRFSWVSVAVMIAVVVFWLATQTGVLGLFFR